jgi:putative FmdB family regulatory protein
MPLYEYLCDACGRQFEVIRKFSDPPLDKCPTCGGPVQKLMSSPAFQFKGSGWYITDYARKDKDTAKPDQRSDEGAADKAKGEKPAEKGEKAAEKGEKGDKPAAASDKADKPAAGDKSQSSAPTTQPKS